MVARPSLRRYVSCAPRTRPTPLQLPLAGLPAPLHRDGRPQPLPGQGRQSQTLPASLGRTRMSPPPLRGRLARGGSCASALASPTLLSLPPALQQRPNEPAGTRERSWPHQHRVVAFFPLEMQLFLGLRRCLTQGPWWCTVLDRMTKIPGWGSTGRLGRWARSCPWVWPRTMLRRAAWICGLAFAAVYPARGETWSKVAHSSPDSSSCGR